MITCPLCKQYVIQRRNDGLPGIFLPDDAIDNFSCPTMELLFKGHCSSHYTRSRYMDGLEYVLMAPPFQVVWVDESKILTVYDNNEKVRNTLPIPIFYQKENAEWEEAVQWSFRLRKLTAFT